MIPRSDAIKLVGAIVCLAVAVVLGYRSHSQRRPREPQIYFYDLSAQELFIAPQASSIPPIPGIDDEEEDGVRAIVVAPVGQCDDEDSRHIAYLERYSPRLKQQFEAFRAAQAGGPPAEEIISRGESQAHTFVKRVTDADWVPMTSREALQIVEAWQVPGPDGKMPVVCVP
jgi:hypothetical protein